MIVVLLPGEAMRKGLILEHRRESPVALAGHETRAAAARRCGRVLPPVVAALGGLCLLAHPLAAQTTRRYTVTLRGTPDDSLVEVVRRTVTLANTHARARIIVRIAVDSAGWGPDDPAARIAGWLARAEGPVYALVDTAWAGGALVALAADSVFMQPEGSLGAGQPESPVPAGAAGDSLRVRLARLVARHGADSALGAAMVNPRVRPAGLAGPPGTLTLSAGEAVATHVAAAVVAGEPALLDRLHLGAARAMDAAEEWAGITIEIRNDNWQDLTFYLDRGAVRERLGLIPSMSRGEYDLGAGHFASGTEFRIVGEIVGSPDTVASEWITVEPGLVVQWRIENRLSFSTIFVHLRS
jgi:hypothetical protein